MEKLSLRVFKLTPFAFSVVAAVLIIVVLIAGSSPSALPGLYLLKVDTSALSVPSKLSTSQYLQDLSTLTATDLTGSTQTPSSLGISPLYRVYVFTCCSPSKCTAPLIGPSFDPMHNLRLSTTSFSGPSRSLEDVLGLYKVISPILGILFILAFVFVLAAPSVGLLESKIKSAGWVAVLMSALTVLCLLVGCVAGQIGMSRLHDGLNSDFGPMGLRAHSGGLLYPAWAALPVCFVNTVLMFVSVKGNWNQEGEEDKDTQNAADARSSVMEMSSVTGKDVQQSRPSWPLAGTEGSRLSIRNTLHEDLSDGWLRESVLGSVDGSRRFTGDGSRASGARNSDPDAWYVAYRQPVRMPEYTR